MKTILKLSILIWVSAFTAFSQINVTNYGAAGDAVQFYVNTVSNSTLVTTTNQLSAADIGKAIEIWSAGAQTYGLNSYNVQATNNQDLVTAISNVVSGTNIYLQTKALNTTTNTFATYGTDNFTAITNAINSQANTNPAVVNFPAGTFLFLGHTNVEPNSGNGYWQWHGIPLHRAGISFIGAGPTNTKLLAQGAWQIKNIPNQTNLFATRGAMFEIFAPFDATDTNPIVVSGMTLDGGVTNGLLNVQNQSPANMVDGLGWDGTSTAYVETGDQDSGGRLFASRPFMQIMTNCTIQHWRGEMVKSVSSYTNGTAYIENCLFRDGNATALNYYPSTLDVGFCTFSNFFQLCEEGFHQFGNSSIHDCLATNIFGNVLVFNGGSLAYRSWNVARNSLYGAGTFSNAANRYWFVIGSSTMQNVTIISNTIGGIGAFQQSYIQLGYAGGQLDTMFPNNTNDNFNIIGNTFLTTDGAGGSWAVIISSGATGYRNANINFSSNNILCSSCGGIYCSDGPITNVTCSGNTFAGRAQFISGRESNKYVLIQTNNTFQSWPIGYEGTPVAQSWAYDYGASSSTLNGGGPKLYCNNLYNWSVVALDDSAAAQIKMPAGAVMTVDNTTNQYGATVLVYPSLTGIVVTNVNSYGNIYSISTNLTPISLPVGQQMPFYWNGSAWATNSAGNTQPSWLFAPVRTF